MANPEYVQSQLGGVESGLRRALMDVFRYVLGNLRIGRPSTQTRSENLQAYFLSGRTAGIANEEFSIPHGLNSAPYLLVPVLDLQATNAELVPLKVTKAADTARVYLSSSAVDTPFTVLVEAS